MKKVFASLLIALYAILITSCDSKANRVAEIQKTEQQQIDKISQQVAKSIYAPEFKQSEDFINNVLEFKQKQRYEAIITRLTLSEINEMAKVIIHRDGHVDWKSFLKEYDASYQTVYRYLNEPDDTSPTTKSDTIFKTGSKNNNLNIVKDGTTHVNSGIQRQ